MKFYLIIVVILLASCYSRKKAQVQHGKAVTVFPEIGADYCARIYPPKDSIIKGDTVLAFDTIYTEGEIIFDTIPGDTIRIVKTVQLPGVRIIERTTVHDTIVRINTAEVDLWRIQANKALDIATDKTKEADKWRKIAKSRFWMLVGAGAIIALGIFGFLRKRLTKPL